MTDSEVATLTGKSALVQKYEQTVNKDSAYEMLTTRMEQAVQDVAPTIKKNVTKEQPNVFQEVIGSRAGKTFMNTFARELGKFALGMITGRKR